MTFVQIQTTLPSREEADAVARLLVDAHLAACVHVVGPITSTYRWQGCVEVAEEWLCQAKTRGERFDAAASAIRAAHPDENPEIVAVPIVAGSAAYLEWLSAETES